MARQYLGLDFGNDAVSAVILEESDKRLALVWCGREAYGQDLESENLHQALSKLLAAGRSKVEAVAANLDALHVLSTKRKLPFNDPKIIEQVLAQNLTDIWQKTDEMQLTFEVLGETELVSEEEGEESRKAYEVYVLSYPKEVLAQQIASYKEGGVDPQVLLPEQTAVQTGAPLILTPQSDVWGILDLGATQTVLSVFEGSRTVLTRTIKLGSTLIDDAYAQTFGLLPQDATILKQNCAFVAPADLAHDWAAHFIAAGHIQESAYDPAQLSQTTLAALSQLLAVLNQSLASIRAKDGLEIQRLYTTGGGMSLPGFDHVLASQFNTSVLPIENALNWQPQQPENFSWCAATLATNAFLYTQEQCPLNLRQGAFAYKGSLEFINDNKGKLLLLLVLVIACFAFMAIMQFRAVNQESQKLRTALEQASENVLGSRLLDKNSIITEMEKGANYAFIPKLTAFSHFEWLSTQIHENLADVQFDLSALEIDSYQKKVVIRGEVTGDEGLPKLMKLLETYECFPNEIQEPRTQKVKDQVSFTLRIDANHCATGGQGE